MKKKEMKWYAFYHDSNNDKIVKTNVIREDLINEIKKSMKKPDFRIGHIVNSLEDLREIVKGNLMYHYWSKCEYEMIVKGLFGDEEYKVSIYDQLEPNLDRIVEYISKEMRLNLVWNLK